MLTGMTEDDWAIVLEVFDAVQSRRGEPGHDDRKFLEAAKTLHLNRRQRLRHVVIPGAVPQALVGLRQSLGVAWLSLIVAETVSASSGLGYMINHAREFLQTDVIVVGLAVYSILGLLTDSVVRFLERRALSWRA